MGIRPAASIALSTAPSTAFATAPIIGFFISFYINFSISLDLHEGQRKTTPPALNRFSQDRHL
jgi:hypothetical protein